MTFVTSKVTLGTFRVLRVRGLDLSEELRSGLEWVQSSPVSPVGGDTGGRTPD